MTLAVYAPAQQSPRRVKAFSSDSSPSRLSAARPYWVANSVATA
jgi:hypothetical protein